MITVISGTNRIGSNTLKVAQKYHQYLLEKGENDAQLWDLNQLPRDFVFPEMYQSKADSFQMQQDQYLAPAEKLIILSPEYNGCFSGILKLVIDAADIKSCFHGKKVCLAGVGSGRAGNSRGLDAMTNMFHYLKMEVYSLKIPISGIDGLLSEDGQFEHESTLKLIESQVDGFLAF